MAHIGPTEIYTPLTYNDSRLAPQTQDQVGTVWNDIDGTLGARKFRFVLLKATSAALIAGDVVVWTNNYATTVSSAQADSNRNCLAGCRHRRTHPGQVRLDPDGRLPRWREGQGG